MNLFRLSEDAKRDEAEIWYHIAQDNIPAADRFIDILYKKYQKLASYPEMGRRREDLAPDLRSFPVSNYLIFYRPTLKGVEIARIIHGSRDIATLF